MHARQEIGRVTTAVKVRRACWLLVSSLLFRPLGTKLFRGWRLLLLRLFGAEIEGGAEVYCSAKIWAPWNLRLEAGSCIGPDTIVYNQALVTLKRNACLSQYAYICTAGHSAQEVNNAASGLIVAPVTLHEEAWIGTRAYINMGVEVGRRAVVGACACVFHDVDPGSVVGGNPARSLRTNDN